MKFSYRVLDVVKNLVPSGLRKWVRLHISLRGFDLARSEEYRSVQGVSGEDFENSPVRLGIISDETYMHSHYVKACRDMKISFRIIDLLADDWVSRIEEANCDAFLAWPSASGTMIKAAIDMRLKLLEEDMGKTLFPSWKECWLTEYKPRLRDWLQIHGIPHPKTWVFYREDEALSFARKFDFKGGRKKVVVKTATGAAGCGVRIVSGNRALCKLAKGFFRKGMQIRAFEPWDRARGYFFVQEYIPGVEEWRMVRIGDSYFGHRKDIGADGKHSGSHACSYLDPGLDLLNLLKRVTDVGGFRSMDVDVFRSADGHVWVNECQTTFGCSVATTQMKIDGIEGRYQYKDGKWEFESGSYCANHCCNLRLIDLLRQLGCESGKVVVGGRL